MSIPGNRECAIEYVLYPSEAAQKILPDRLLVWARPLVLTNLELMWIEIIKAIALVAIFVGAIKMAHNSINNPGYIEWKTTSDAEEKQKKDEKLR